MALLDRVINWIMTDKDRLTLIVNYLKKHPEKPHTLNDILTEHKIIMSDATRSALWEMIGEGIIIWYPNGSIQYNSEWRKLYE